MAAGNIWLDAYIDSGEEDELEHGSGDAEESRVNCASKRRKIAPAEDDETENEDDDIALTSDDEGADNRHQGAGALSANSRHLTGLHGSYGSDQDQGNAIETLSDSLNASEQHTEKTKTTTTSESSRTNKSGVVYISRVPPFMKPTTLRNLLSSHAPKGLGRLFLTPEDPTSHAQRARSGGNKKRSFTDGWIEFVSKKDAKRCVEALNTRILGGKKTGWYHDDVWNLKYLKGFKWHHLTEQIANENAERASRIRAEVAQTNRENKRFLANVERAKKLRGIEEKRILKRTKADLDSPAKTDTQDLNVGKLAEARGPTRHFRQNEVKQRLLPENTAITEQPSDVQRVLSKIF